MIRVTDIYVSVDSSVEGYSLFFLVDHKTVSLGEFTYKPISPELNFNSGDSLKYRIIFSVLAYVTMVSSSNSEECGVLLHCHYSQFHSELEWVYLLGSYLWVNFFKNQLYLIGSCAKKNSWETTIQKI